MSEPLAVGCLERNTSSSSNIKIHSGSKAHRKVHGMRMISGITFTPEHQRKLCEKDEKGDGDNVASRKKELQAAVEQVSNLVESHVLQRDIVDVTNHRVELRTNWQRRALQENRCVSARTGASCHPPIQQVRR